MKQIYYLFFMLIAVILAPILALVIAVYTFFTSMFGAIAGSHGGLVKSLFGQKEVEPTGVWEKHIKRLKTETKNKTE